MAGILTADDHPLVRHAFRSVLTAKDELEVLGEAANGREVLEACEELRPDLVLMYLSMPKISGMKATRRIKSERPETVILVVTADDSEGLVLEAMRAGAAGYVLKSEKSQPLIEAGRAALANESPIDAGLIGGLMSRLAAGDGHPGTAEDNGRPDPAPPEPAALLTPHSFAVAGRRRLTG